MPAEPPIEVHPVTAQRLGDVGDLFGSNGTTRGCWCMFFIAERSEFSKGWRSGGNRRRFGELAVTSGEPVGLLAYEEGKPVGWCAAGPRSRYPRVLGPRARVLRDREPDEDDVTWLVPCFFVRVGYRRRGTTRALLQAAVELAAASGARAIEGFPRRSGQAPSPDDYLGREEWFAECGFACIARPTPQRVVMRRDL